MTKEEIINGYVRVVNAYIAESWDLTLASRDPKGASTYELYSFLNKVGEEVDKSLALKLKRLFEAEYLNDWEDLADAVASMDEYVTQDDLESNDEALIIAKSKKGIEDCFIIPDTQGIVDKYF